MVALDADEEKEHARLFSLGLILIEYSILMTTPGTKDVGVSECWIRPQIRRNSDLFFSHRQQIIPVHTLVLADLVVLTYPASVDHNATVLVRFRIKQVVALRTKVQGSHDESKGEWNLNGMLTQASGSRQKDLSSSDTVQQSS